MFEIGRVCMKIAGRDAGKYGVIVDNVDERTVIIDGQTRRRKCNILHLEPTQDKVKISKDVSHEKVVEVLKTLNILCQEKAAQAKQPTTRAKRIRKKKEKVFKTKKE
ncbi:50S ribosomal protein L14e [Candidatus Woesearchaeota archaeon]|nr:50S ribosomal protein L14e [Candidatus Woesearchaeota archaeon]